MVTTIVCYTKHSFVSTKQKPWQVSCCINTLQFYYMLQKLALVWFEFVCRSLKSMNNYWQSIYLSIVGNWYAEVPCPLSTTIWFQDDKNVYSAARGAWHNCLKTKTLDLRSQQLLILIYLGPSQGNIMCQLGDEIIYFQIRVYNYRGQPEHIKSNELFKQYSLYVIDFSPIWTALIFDLLNLFFLWPFFRIFKLTKQLVITAVQGCKVPPKCQ